MNDNLEAAKAAVPATRYRDVEFRGGTFRVRSKAPLRVGVAWAENDVATLIRCLFHPDDIEEALDVVEFDEFGPLVKDMVGGEGNSPASAGS